MHWIRRFLTVLRKIKMWLMRILNVKSPTCYQWYRNKNRDKVQNEFEENE